MFQIDSSLGSCGMISASAPVSDTCPDVLPRESWSSGIGNTGQEAILDCQWMVQLMKGKNTDDSQMVAASQQTSKTSDFVSDITLHP